MNERPDRPAHYRKGGIECVDALKAVMTAEEYRGFLHGNVIKYLWRYQDKGGVNDLFKGQVYLYWLIEAEQERCRNEERDAKTESAGMAENGAEYHEL